MPLARFRFTLKATSPIILPLYKGAVFRGAFGGVFRRIVCANPRGECADCLLIERCLYPSVFEAKPPPDFPDAEKFTPAPPPFVLNPPLTNRQLFHRNENLKFDLVLMGRFVDAMPYFVYTFTEIGRRGIGRDRGTFILDRIDHINGHTATPIYNNDSQKLTTISTTENLTFEPENGLIDELTLDLLTPLRLKNKGRLASRLSFPLLFERLLQRLALLFGLYGSNGKMPDLAVLIKKANQVRVTFDLTHWYEWERYSTRQKTSMKFGGLRGKITFSGELSEFMPLLRMGEQVNVGSGTSFGLGRFKIFPLTDS